MNQNKTKQNDFEQTSEPKQKKNAALQLAHNWIHLYFFRVFVCYQTASPFVLVIRYFRLIDPNKAAINLRQCLFKAWAI